MIRKIRSELDISKLDELCQERKLQRLLSIRVQDNKIAENWIPHSVPVTRSYGVEWEGDAYDVWHHILDPVTNPREIKNLWQVSGMFRAILRGKYIQTRLPELVKLISDKRPQYWNYPKVPEVLGEHDKERTDGKFRMTTFLSMRHLSKQCKESVEDICHSEECYMPSLHPGEVDEVQDICERLEENPSIAASHFPRFGVVIGESMRLDLGQFHRVVTDFLRLIGHRIHHFNYYSSLGTSKDIYFRLQELVSFMPNLELLSVHIDAMDNEDVPVQEEIESFPTLPRLRCIPKVYARGGALCSPFVQRILNACPGIQDLQLIEEDNKAEPSPQILETLLNLTSLQIPPYRSILKCHNLPWKLKKLILGDPGGFSRTTVSSCSLFPFLKQFEETLEHLDFDYNDFVNCCDDYLELKNLKILEVKLHESYKNLNFLLYVEKLETLKIRVGNDYFASTEAECRKMISTSFLGKSIWDVFPYLKWFKLRPTYYSWNDKNLIEEFRHS